MGFFSKNKDSSQKDKVQKKSKKQQEKEEQQQKEEEEREQRIQIAIRFLANPSVKNVSVQAKKAFFKKKGLSDSDIEQAFKGYKEQLEQDKQQLQVEQQQNQIATIQTTDPELTQQQPVQKEETVESLISKAKQTEFLSLRNMNLENIDEQVFQVENLKTLLINNNPIKLIPDTISQLQNLRIFQAIGCGIYLNQISEELFKLPQIIELNFNKNKLNSINFICSLPNLQKFEAADNEIIEIPEEIEQCAQLKSLNLRNNNITDIPNTLSKLQNLKRLQISGNNLDNKIVEALQKDGIQGLFSYLSQNY